MTDDEMTEIKEHALLAREGGMENLSRVQLNRMALDIEKLVQSLRIERRAHREIRARVSVALEGVHTVLRTRLPQGDEA